jgi:hypothetical protein
VVLYTLDGRFLRSFITDIRAEGQPIGIDPQGHVRLEQTYSAPGDSVRTQWVLFTLRGQRVDSITRPPQPSPPHWEVLVGTRHGAFTVPYAAMPRAGFLPDGSLVYGSTALWEFVVGRDGRDSAMVFRRVNVDPVPLPAAYADTVFAEATDRPELKGVAKGEEMPTVFPAWNDFVVDGLGNLWVSTGYRHRNNHYWAVFGPDGRYRGWVGAWFDQLNMSSWGTDQVAFLGWVERRRPVVRMYRIERPEER